MSPPCPVRLLKTVRLLETLEYSFSAPARQTSLDIGWVSPRALNITCEANEVYPEPIIRILINSPSLANER